MVVAALCCVSKDRKPLELMKKLMKPNIGRKTFQKLQKIGIEVHYVAGQNTCQDLKMYLLKWSPSNLSELFFKEQLEAISISTQANLVTHLKPLTALIFVLFVKMLKLCIILLPAFFHGFVLVYQIKS